MRWTRVMNGETQGLATTEKWWQQFRWWFACAAVVAAAITGFLFAGTQTSADSPAGEPLNCTSCHSKTALRFHDKLGSGNTACLVCHDATDMKKLRLLNGNTLPRSESSQVCGQCHQERYAAWKAGTHGIPGTVAAVSCTTCHNPHQPQMAFLNMTKPHPPPDHTPPPPSVDLAVILGTTFLSLVVIGIVISKQRKPA
ncbi:MAG: hypothetical protein HYX79_05705 [Chloroflexi bacterium]|nr:hypothetical protein [Chloroflexota bacterium]